MMRPTRASKEVRIATVVVSLLYLSGCQQNESRTTASVTNMGGAPTQLGDKESHTGKTEKTRKVTKDKEDRPPLPNVNEPNFHETIGAIDLHVDTLYQLHKSRSVFGKRSGAELNPALAKRGGLVGQFFALWVDPEDVNRWQTLRSEMRLFKRQVLAHDNFELARSASELRAIRKRGKIAAFLSLEGASALDGEIERFKQLVREGVSLASITWNEDNLFGTGAKTRSSRGLTSKGRKLLKLMEELGVAIDVSHASRATFWDIATHTKTALWASHSNASALRPHARNLDDAQLWAIRDSDGIVGLNFHSTFLSQKRRATVQDVVKHAVHMKRVMGAQHIALGSDFDGEIRAPRGLEDVADLPSLTRALADAGFTGEELNGLLSANVLRALESIEGGRVAPGFRYKPAFLDKKKMGRQALGERRLNTMFDRNVTTGWTRSRGAARPLEIRFKTKGLGLDRVSICGSSTQPVSVRLRVASSTGELMDEVVELSSSNCPLRIAVPRGACERQLFFQLQVPAAWTGTISEILPEVRRVDCSLEQKSR